MKVPPKAADEGGGGAPAAFRNQDTGILRTALFTILLVWSKTSGDEILHISIRSLKHLHLPGKVQADFCSILFHIHTFTP